VPWVWDALLDSVLCEVRGEGGMRGKGQRIFIPHRIEELAPGLSAAEVAKKLQRSTTTVVTTSRTGIRRIWRMQVEYDRRNGLVRKQEDVVGGEHDAGKVV